MSLAELLPSAVSAPAVDLDVIGGLVLMAGLFSLALRGLLGLEVGRPAPVPVPVRARHTPGRRQRR